MVIYDLSIKGSNSQRSMAGLTESSSLQKSILKHFNLQHTDGEFTGNKWRFGGTPSMNHYIAVYDNGSRAEIGIDLRLETFNVTKEIRDRGIEDQEFSCSNLYAGELSELFMGVTFGLDYSYDRHKGPRCIFRLDITDLCANTDKVRCIATLLNSYTDLDSK
ncbi:hypothetical protein F7U66_10975 [Vibrio parahaemolyticus]|nr:hypothetical protein [Vibrio parahaemolyticus]